MKSLTKILVIILSSLAISVQAHEAHKTADDSKAVTTKMAMRDLWVDHIFWVRSVVVAAASKDKGAQAAAEAQVVENAKKIAGTIEPFYGKAASDKLFELLAGHYGAVKDYMTATLPKPNAAKQKAATGNLLANAEAIATFLSGANPNLPKPTLYGLLTAHGNHHVDQINQFQKKDYSGEAQTWAAMKQHMYVIADALVGGIAKQFPDKF